MSGWGGHPRVQGHERRSEDLERITRDARADARARAFLRRLVAAAAAAARGRGLARSPIACSPSTPPTGVVRAEAGLRAHEAEPPLPAARLVHAGDAGHALRHARRHGGGRRARQEPPRRPAASASTCARCACASPTAASSSAPTTHERELFRATLGGMGLTGHILEVEFQMQRIPSPWIWQESERIADLDDVLERLKEAGRQWPFTVGWIDFLAPGRALGRGLLMKGRWAEPARGAAGTAALARRAGTAVFDCRAGSCSRGWCALGNIALLLGSTARGRARGHRAPGDVLLSARRRPQLEPRLRPARLHAVPVRAARRRTRTRATALPRAAARARRAGLLVRDQGLRGGGQGDALVPASRASRTRSTFPVAARTPRRSSTR